MDKTERRLLERIGGELGALLSSHKIEYGYTRLYGKGGYEYEQQFWEILRAINFLLEKSK